MKHILLCMLFTVYGFTHAQTTITGRVTDKESNEPLPFVNIASNTTGTITDENGNYSIEISTKTNRLQFSFLGYKTETISTENKTIINVSLTEDAAALNEVVITALGIKRNTKALGYSVQAIKSNDLTEVKTVNFLDNLQGKLAGVTVTQGATGIGTTSKITIRGEASFSNNNPLFVVDGTPINNETVFNFTNQAAAGFQEIDFGNGAMEVNPDDIESVTVLKGANAAALYGTRAANGVIVIKTKDGNKQKGFRVSLNTSVTLDSAFKLPEFQNTYGQGQSGQFEFVDGLGGGTSDNLTYSWGPKLDAGILIPQFDSPVQLSDGSFVRGGDTSLYSGLPITATAFNSNPDNLKDFYKTGVTTTNNISISNGFDNGSYRLSFTDLRSESIIPDVWYGLVSFPT